MDYVERRWQERFDGMAERILETRRFVIKVDGDASRYFERLLENKKLKRKRD